MRVVDRGEVGDRDERLRTTEAEDAAVLDEQEADPVAFVAQQVGDGGRCPSRWSLGPAVADVFLTAGHGLTLSVSRALAEVSSEVSVAADFFNEVSVVAGRTEMIEAGTTTS